MLTKKGYIGEDGRGAPSFDSFADFGFFPIISTDAYEYIYGHDDEKLKQIWVNNCNQNKIDRRESQEGMERIRDSIPSIKAVLRSIYNHMSMAAHLKDGFRALSWAVKNTIKKQEITRIDFYANYSIDTFPELPTR